MTEDLEAIDLLSERFDQAVANAPRHEGSGIIGPDDLIERGHKVLRMYEAEALKASDDMDVRRSIAVHLFRLARLYQASFLPIFFRSDDKSKRFKQAEYIQAACAYACQSMELCPSPGPAALLASIFRVFGFYGTALHWYKETEKLAAEADRKELVTEAKANRLDLQADGKISDPAISRSALFPTIDTAGLLLAEHPKGAARSEVTLVASPPEASSGDSIIQMSNGFVPQYNFVPPKDADSEYSIDEDSLDFCYHCGVELNQASARCPACGEEL